MKSYMLDTNACVDVMRDARGPVAIELERALRRHNQVLISIVARLEMQAGALASAKPSIGFSKIEGFLSYGVEVVPFEQSAMIATASFAHSCRATGQKLQIYDGMIAGHAIALGATLVTADQRLTTSLKGQITVANWRLSQPQA